MSKPFNPYDPRLSWEWAIGLARKGAPAELAKLVIKSAAIPDDLKRDVELVIANPVHKRGVGGRPAKLSRSAVRQIRGMFRGLTTDFPADDTGPAHIAWPKTKAINQIVRDLKIDVSTVRDILNHKKSYDYD